MATAGKELTRAVSGLGDIVYLSIAGLGEMTIFTAKILGWLMVRLPGRGTLLPSFYMVGVRSMPVVALTGMFIGMVLAVQSYSTFHEAGLSTHLGAIINISVVREFGPVLAAVMLAGRVGSAMAAELATMRITEQVDALACLGANPLHYLVVPRLLACVLLIPLLTIMADFMGVMGGAMICLDVFHIEAFHYWEHAQGFVTLWDIGTSLVKPTFFGAAIALISCHRGLNSLPGAEGVGRAATEAFVASFIAVLVLDFFLGLFLNNLYEYLWPGSSPRLL
jgi:phospholipid/cholesterol/gamma-HCH transport system permease protein